jgi:hypothetical protein
MLKNARKTYVLNTGTVGAGTKIYLTPDRQFYGVPVYSLIFWYDQISNLTNVTRNVNNAQGIIYQSLLTLVDFENNFLYFELPLIVLTYNNQGATLQVPANRFTLFPLNGNIDFSKSYLTLLPGTNPNFSAQIAYTVFYLS